MPPRRCHHIEHNRWYLPTQPLRWGMSYHEFMQGTPIIDANTFHNLCGDLIERHWERHGQMWILDVMREDIEYKYWWVWVVYVCIIHNQLFIFVIICYNELPKWICFNAFGLMAIILLLGSHVFLWGNFLLLWTTFCQPLWPRVRGCWGNFNVLGQLAGYPAQKIHCILLDQEAQMLQHRTRSRLQPIYLLKSLLVTWFKLITTTLIYTTCTHT